jgi:excisionase family DNA binding protein
MVEFRHMVKRNKTREPLTLTPREAARLTGIGTNAVYALLHSGEMPSIKSGKKFFIPMAALMKWLENCGEKNA